MSLVRDGQHLKWIQSQLTPTLMGFIFSVHCRQELHLLPKSLIPEISQLQSIFPRSLFLEGQRALVFYRMKDLYEASSLFSTLLVSDPRCLDFLHHYSNVLHSLGCRERLSFVAQLSSSIDPYRPETCCVIGNYYSLSSQHEDAVLHFRRALTLDRDFSPAWTLLGHEYAELQNTHAAIDSYRHATELNNKDYRAFAGLGRAYEALERADYSLHYYRRALALRPGDVDLWQMLATCLLSLGRTPQAIGAWKRAIACTIQPAESRFANDAVGTKQQRIKLFYQLANTYEEMQNRQEAMGFLAICLHEFEALDGLEDVGGGDSGRGVLLIVSRARSSLARLAAAAAAGEDTN